MFWKCVAKWTVPGPFPMASISSDTILTPPLFGGQNFWSVLVEGQVLGKLERTGITLMCDVEALSRSSPRTPVTTGGSGKKKEGA